MSQRRVVVTGMGIVSPVGSTIDTAWNAICNGRSGISTVASFDAGHMKTRIAGEVVDFDAANYLEPSRNPTTGCICPLRFRCVG